MSESDRASFAAFDLSPFFKIFKAYTLFCDAAAACLSLTTRGRAHLTSQTPRRQHSSEVSFVNFAEEAKLDLASHATAAAGERGVCAPRAAASAGSHEPLLRGSPQESGSYPTRPKDIHLENLERQEPTKLIDPMRRRQGDSAAFYKRYARGDPHGEDEARKSTGRQTAHSACLRLRLYARGTMAALAHALAAWRGLLHHQDASATQAHAQRDTSTNRDASTGAIEKGDLVQSVYSWALDLAAFESEELLASARGSGGGDEMV
ncbi:hypothetical protein EMIHUDRAFT_459363 [Emiliania huxleyi CCMP1516]|uniref:Uncharacterized protein n=2 Tax=Emiliania huxleyi TaxID=2903 RepID=A0A0D3IV78_EMIH1|nr:hypothetical protein EMIHUDRAFT_459363 [Emiliania huxleyi CCMP1516]EOD15163.1 hypothetical protein EMIHUDRAFT_459363 [Emiliania huxleyi CCMP1516]|eukprot:XP_005767592.1 hypothetical protein EMIHUDRAFT_459363 [Emiliania huxleyi CCMP1516]